MKITPNLHMNGNAKEAIAFYRQVLDAEIFSLYCQSDANPADFTARPGETDLVYHAEISIGGQRVMLTDDTAPFPPKGHTLSLVVTFDTAAQVKQAYSAFADGCQIVSPLQKTSYSSCFVSLIDKFGVRWELMTENTEH